MMMMIREVLLKANRRGKIGQVGQVSQASWSVAELA